MTYPKVIIKQSQNTKPKRLSDQLEQAKSAFGSARAQLVAPVKKKALIPPNLAKRFALLTPYSRTVFVMTQCDTGSDRVRRTQQCINHWNVSNYGASHA